MKNGGVSGVVIEIYWGMVEGHTPHQYYWTGFDELVHMVHSIGLQAQVRLLFNSARCSFDYTSCFYPLPSWIVAHGASHPGMSCVCVHGGDDDTDAYYTDVRGHRHLTYLSLGYDHQVIHGRTVLDIYRDFMSDFVQHFLGSMSTTITSIQIGLGPNGELRYPNTPTDEWYFPGVGAFTCYDDNMRTAWTHLNTTYSLPTEQQTGYYLDKPYDTSFFSNGTGGYDSVSGRLFVDWYAHLLVQHGRDVLTMARATLDEYNTTITLSAALPLAYWWYDDITGSRAPVLTAGYGADGYCQVMTMMRELNVQPQITGVELLTADWKYNDAGCDPEALVMDLIQIASDCGVGAISASNLFQLDTDYGEHYDHIVEMSHNYSFFVFQRCSINLLWGNYWELFVKFVIDMSR